MTMTNNNTPTGTPLITVPAARHLTTAGAATALIGTFLAWTWTAEFPGDLTVTGYPGGLQVLTLVGAALTLLLALSGYGIKGLRWLTPGGANSPVRLAAIGVLGTTGFTIGAISVELGGIVNLEPGAWVSLAGAIIAVAASLGLPTDQPLDDTIKHNPLDRFLNTLRAPRPNAPRTSPTGPRSSSSPQPSASHSTSSPTESTPSTPNSSSATSSASRSASPHSTGPDSSPASPG
ncbi:hypothetical protein SCALM49S_03576 [Streptomyces californicus]